MEIAVTGSTQRKNSITVIQLSFFIIISQKQNANFSRLVRREVYERVLSV